MFESATLLLVYARLCHLHAGKFPCWCRLVCFFCATLDFCNQVTDAGVCAVWSLRTVVSINAEAKRFVTDRGGLIQQFTLEKKKTINKQSLGFPFQHFLQQHWSATVFREATPIDQQQIVTTESLAPAHLNDDLKLQGAETSEVWVANE